MNPLAASGPDATTPMATAIHVSASTNRAMSPSAATQSSADACGVEPDEERDADRRARSRRRCAPSTPRRARSARRSARMGRDRNRSMMPPVMSVATSTAVFADPYPAVSRMMPGTTKST